MRPSKLAEPTGLEQAYIVRRVLRERMSAESAGISPKDIDELLKKTRLYLSEDFGLTPPQIRAFTAHGEHIRPKRAEKGEYTPRDRMFARNYVALARTPAERVEHIAEVAQMLDLSPEIIHELTQGVRTEMERLTELLSGTKAARLLEDIQEDVPQRQPGGEHAFYETESKHAHRKCVGDLITVFAARDRLALMNMCCLPNEECGEIPMLLERGLSKDRIWALEGGDRRAQSEFRHHARRLELPYAITQRTDEFLPKCTIRWHMYHGDYLSPPSPTNVRDMRHLLLAEQALVITNGMAKREKWIKAYFERLWTSITTQVQTRYSLMKKFGIPVEEDESAFDYSLPSVRELSPLLLSIGRDRRENWFAGGSFREFPLLEQNASIKNERDRQEANLHSGLDPLLGEIVDLLHASKCFDPKNVEDQMALANLESLFFDSVFGNPRLANVQKFRYSSDVSQGKSPFFIDAATVRTPLSLYNSMGPAINFLLTCVERCLKVIRESDGDTDAISRISFQILRGGYRIDANSAIRKDHLACCLDETCVASVQLFRLENALREYHEGLTRSVDTVKLFEMRKNERVALNGKKH